MIVTVDEPTDTWDIAQDSLCKSFSAYSLKMAGAFLDRPIPAGEAQSNQASCAASGEVSVCSIYIWTSKSYLVPTMRSKKH